MNTTRIAPDGRIMTPAEAWRRRLARLCLPTAILLALYLGYAITNMLLR